MIELLQNYCDNVIKEEIDVLSKTSLRELYKAAFDYKREVIEQDFGDRTSDEQFQDSFYQIYQKEYIYYSKKTTDQYFQQFLTFHHNQY